MPIKRFAGNPIITPDVIKPSHGRFEVCGAFNAGVVECAGETVMLLRVAESVSNDSPDEVSVPLLRETEVGWEVDIKTFQREDPDFDFSDSREIVFRKDRRKVYLTALSHIRIARSTNGTDFVVEDSPFIMPDNRYESYGCEDPRVTLIEDSYFINYTSVSDLGISTSLARTKDFLHVDKMGLIFSPDNRDVCLFPEKIGGYYWALHRPAPLHIGNPEIWIARSTDLVHWGNHQHLLGCGMQGWDQLKIGGGAPLEKTDKGWLQIYHGVDSNQRYCLGALLLDLDDPTKIISRSKSPLLEPTEHYEVSGFFDNVVFCCGTTLPDGVLSIYYGAADQTMALATISLPELWHHLSV